MRAIKAIIAASLLISGAAFAADGIAVLANQQGTVLVNQGEEFVTAVPAQALKAGDRVMVMEGGAADISFNDGCVLVLAPGSLAIVPEVSTCAGSVASVEQISPSYAQAIGAVDDNRCFDNDDSNDFNCAPPVRNSNAGWVFGAWTAGIAWALIDGTYSINPVSP
jgi:hypothetical protein